MQGLWGLLLVGNLVVGFVRVWVRVLLRIRGKLLIRGRGGCEFWVSLVLISRMLLSGLRSVVQLILQVIYLRGKVLEYVLNVCILLSCLG